MMACILNIKYQKNVEKMLVKKLRLNREYVIVMLNLPKNNTQNV